MGTQNKFKKSAQQVTFGIILMVAPLWAMGAQDVSSVRIAHAKELLGGGYKRSVVRHAEKAENVSEFIRLMTEKFLPSKHKSQARRIANAFEGAAKKYGFDPVFLMAVVQNESSFNPEMRGQFKEIGLMQIKPDTAKWIADLSGIRFDGEKSLLDPVQNIYLGAAFLSKLRGQFNSHGRLYLSAYNMGAKGVRRAVARDVVPRDYAQAVMKRYVAIYSAFTVKGQTSDQIKMAFNSVSAITRQLASNR